MIEAIHVHDVVADVGGCRGTWSDGTLKFSLQSLDLALLLGNLLLCRVGIGAGTDQLCLFGADGEVVTSVVFDQLSILMYGYLLA